MKTALQEFIDNVIPMHIIELDMIKQEIKKALEKEKEQIRQAYIFGHYDSSLDIYNPSESYSQIINQ